MCNTEVCVFLFPGQFFNREIKDYKWFSTCSCDGLFYSAALIWICCWCFLRMCFVWNVLHVKYI